MWEVRKLRDTVSVLREIAQSRQRSGGLVEDPRCCDRIVFTDVGERFKELFAR